MNRRHFLKTTAPMLASLMALPRQLTAAGWTPETQLPDLAGFGLEGALPLTKGRVVYLDFWASWCAPCKASFPILNRWHQELSPKGLTLLGVSIDETEAAMRGFLTRTPAAFSIVRDASHKLVAAADVSTMPTAFIISRKGVIRHVHNGFHAKDEASLSAQINALLAER
jgi:thiol-disulfide isomerase/thioredoxin